MSARRVRSDATKRSEFWNVAVDRSDAAKGTKIILKAAVRRSNGTFVGATNYLVGKTVNGARFEG